MESKEKSELSASTRKVDSDYSHFVKWDDLGKDYPYTDFATYPRGRVMYDLDKDTYIVYADACIPDEQIKSFADNNGITSFVTARDLHYRCDRCLLSR